MPVSFIYVLIYLSCVRGMWSWHTYSSVKTSFFLPLSLSLVLVVHFYPWGECVHSLCERVCVCMCVRACVRACVSKCVCACVRACCMQM